LKTEHWTLHPQESQNGTFLLYPKGFEYIQGNTGSIHAITSIQHTSQINGSAYDGQNSAMARYCRQQVEPDEAKSDSECDSNVIVRQGRKCPEVSRTPPYHKPSSMRIMPDHASIEPVSNATTPAPGLL
jgi:hypothetical protein